jgi:hypothetical protein
VQTDEAAEEGEAADDSSRFQKSEGAGADDVRRAAAYEVISD